MPRFNMLQMRGGRYVGALGALVVALAMLGREAAFPAHIAGADEGQAARVVAGATGVPSIIIDNPNGTILDFLGHNGRIVTIHGPDLSDPAPGKAIIVVNLSGRDIVVVAHPLP
jgi:hypothetical protein